MICQLRSVHKEHVLFMIQRLWHRPSPLPIRLSAGVSAWFSAESSPSTLKVHLVEIAAYCTPLDNESLGINSLVVCFQHSSNMWVQTGDLSDILETYLQLHLSRWSMYTISNKYLKLNLFSLGSLITQESVRPPGHVSYSLVFQVCTVKAFLQPSPAYVPTVRSLLMWLNPQCCRPLIHLPSGHQSRGGQICIAQSGLLMLMSTELPYGENLNSCLHALVSQVKEFLHPSGLYSRWIVYLPCL